MSPRRLLSLTLASCALLVMLVAAGIFPFRADALPPGGHDVFNVTAEVDVTSRLGQEVISLTGTVSIEREDPHFEGDIEVADLELTNLHLQGSSLIGNVVVGESPAVFSPGELRSLQPEAQFPASSFIDAFISVTIPANPTPTLTLHNAVALRLVPTDDNVEVPLAAWPPTGVTFALVPLFGFDNDGDTLVDEDTADDDSDGLIDEDRFGPDPDTPGSGFECGANADCDDEEGEDPPADLCPPASQGTPTLCDQDGDGLIDEDPSCVPLLNAGNTHLPHGVCVRDASITIGEAKTPTPTQPAPSLNGQTFSVAPGGPSGLHPASLLELATGGSTGPVQVSGNDNFATAHTILGLPFTGLQTTTAFTVEAGENLLLPGCVVVPPNEKGKTAWYKYTPAVGGSVTVDTEGSTFDTVLAMYTGATLQTLSLIGCDDDSGTGLLSEMSVALASGTTYYVQVGGFNADSGSLVLNVSGPGGAGGSSAPTVRITCQALGLTADGCDLGEDGDQDDLDALSYGAEFAQGEYAYALSPAPASLGLAGSGVNGQATCSPAQAQADEFSTTLNGSNALAFDGDGEGPACPTADPIGLLELPQSDDLDAIELQPPVFVDEDSDGQLDRAVYFSLATGSPSLATLGRSPGDILWTNGSGAPGTYASRQVLGLGPGDDIDALCIVDRGAQHIYEAGVDTVVFSLAAGSPALAGFGMSAADTLRPGPQRIEAASLLGLRAADDLDALGCRDFDAPPPPTPTVTPTPQSGQAGDANCSGSVNSIDAAVMLQLTAGLLSSVPCPALADVNDDGAVNSLDAALVLQFVAGLLNQLPP